MSLTQALKQYNQKSRQRIPSEALAVMDASTQALIDANLSSAPPTVGDMFPQFTLHDHQGNKVSLSEISAPFLVIAFYRGGWCPYCNIELKALQDILPQIHEAEGELIAISPETPGNSLSTVEKNELSFRVLTDTDNYFAKKLNLVFELPEQLNTVYRGFGINLDLSQGNEKRELPMPATFILNHKREIIHSFAPEDYTKRLDPEEILEVLHTASKA